MGRRLGVQRGVSRMEEELRGVRGKGRDTVYIVEEGRTLRRRIEVGERTIAFHPFLVHRIRYHSVPEEQLYLHNKKKMLKKCREEGCVRGGEGGERVGREGEGEREVPGWCSLVPLM